MLRYQKQAMFVCKKGSCSRYSKGEGGGGMLERLERAAHSCRNGSCPGVEKGIS